MSSVSHKPLFLHEEILLLALRAREGTIPARASHFPFALGGAILSELLLAQRARVSTEGKRDFVEAVDHTSLEDALLDECLGMIAAAKRRATVQAWVGRFTRLKGLKHRVARGLVARRILRSDEHKVLLVFTRSTYPVLDARPERELVRRLRQTIFGHGHDVPPRTVVLLSLAWRTGLLKLVFDRKRLKERKARIEQVVRGERTGKAAKKAIEAMQAAVLSAAVVPIMVARS